MTPLGPLTREPTSIEGPPCLDKADTAPACCHVTGPLFPCHLPASSPTPVPSFFLGRSGCSKKKKKIHQNKRKSQTHVSWQKGRFTTHGPRAVTTKTLLGESLNWLNLRNNRFKFKTSGGVPIILGESIEYI